MKEDFQKEKANDIQHLQIGKTQGNGVIVLIGIEVFIS